MCSSLFILPLWSENNCLLTCILFDDSSFPGGFLRLCCPVVLEISSVIGNLLLSVLALITVMNHHLSKKFKQLGNYE